MPIPQFHEYSDIRTVKASKGHAARTQATAAGLRRSVARELRALGTELDRFDHTVADALGVNRTDMRCMEILFRAGPLTAGRLAHLARLSRAATTTVIDRMEAAGFARRSPDPSDRRRVVVSAAPGAGARVGPLFAGLAARTGAVLGSYARSDLELLGAFVSQVREAVEAEADRVSDLVPAERPPAAVAAVSPGRQ